MGAHIEWPQNKHDAPVWVTIGNGADEILKDGYLTAILKGHAIQTVGVMLDADTKPKGRYGQIRHLCRGMFPSLPDEIPEAGLIVDNDDEKRLGVWIMPDNSSDGGIETFLKYLVPNKSESQWVLANECVARARGIGAECREAHVEKANLFTWLAWQDPPGQYPGIALSKKILDPHAASAAAFVAWFRALYRL